MRTASWVEVPLKSLYRRRDITGRPDLELLSVYRDLGVVRREGREDNYNRPGENLSAYRLVRPGDLVLNKMKTWQGSLGVSKYEGIVSPAYFVCEQVRESEPRYLHHLLRSQALIAQYAMRSKGIRPSQWDLPWEEFRGIRVVLPPVAVQRIIADYLDAETARIDALIAKKRRMTDVLREKLSSERHSAVTNVAAQPRRQAGWLGTLPSSCTLVPLRRVARIFMGTSFPQEDQGELIGDVPFVKVADLRNAEQNGVLKEPENWISHEVATRLRARVLPAGCLLYARVGGALLLNPRVIAPWECVVDDNVRGLHFSVGPTDYWLQVLRLLDLAEVANPGPVPSVSEEQVMSTLVPLPDETARTAVATQLGELGEIIANLRSRLDRQIERLIEHRQGVITAAVCGELDLPRVAA